MTLVTLALTLAAPALADDCVYWSRAFSSPHVEVGITGTVCRIDRDRAYVAGAEFVTVDISTWDSPVATGRVALPAPALDVAIAWPNAYVACGASGIVQIDISNPADPRITRSYDPSPTLIRVAAVGIYAIGLDTNALLHILGPGMNGSLAALSVLAGPEQVVGIAAAGRFLAVLGPWSLSMVDLTDFRTLDVVSSVPLSLEGYSVNCSLLAATSSDVVVMRTYAQMGSYTSWLDTYVKRFEVSADGSLTLASAWPAIAGGFRSVGCDGDRVVLAPDPAVGNQATTTNIRQAASLQFEAQLPVSGQSVAVSGTVLALASTTGLTTVRLPRATMQPQPVTVAAPPTSAIPYGYDGPYNAMRWSWPWGLHTTEYSSYSGYHSGYSNKWVWYTLLLGDDQVGMASLTTGQFSDYIDYANNPCGGTQAWVMGINDQRALLVTGQRCSRQLRLWDQSRRQFIGTITNYCVEPGLISESLTDGILWTYGSAGRQRFDVASATPLAPLAPLNLRRDGKLLVADRNLLVVRIDAAKEFDVYDTSDSTTVRYASTIAVPATGYNVYDRWFGRMLAYATTTGMYVIDFRDPGHPALLSTTVLSRQPSSQVATDPRGRIVHACSWVTSPPTAYHYGLQVLDIGADGQVTCHDAGETGKLYDGLALSGDLLYADRTTMIQAFDLSNPDAPVALGSMGRGSGEFGLAGEHVAAGNLLIPRDCRDLHEPHLVAIDVLPLLKPGQPGHPTGYQGPALVPVVVRTDPLFAVDPIDPGSVRFGPGGAAPVNAPGDKIQVPLDPVLPRGADATFWFRLDDTGIASTHGTVSLTGRTLGGEKFLGMTTLEALPPRPVGDEPVLEATPNPFNPRTTLNYKVTEEGPWQLAIFDLRGRRVRMMRDGSIAAGRGSIIWDGTDDAGLAVASGVYIARLTGAGGTVTQRLALLR